MRPVKSIAPPRRRGRLAVLLVATIAVTLGLSGLLTAGSSGGVVTVQLKRTGSGPPARTVGGVQIVDGSTAEVLAATAVGVRGKAKLRPPAGVEFAVASIARPKGLRQGVSAPFRLDGDATLKLRIALEPTSATLGVRPATIRALVAAESTVATLGPVTIAGPDGENVSIAGPLFTPLFKDTTDFLRWVDTSEALRRARQRELDLQDRGLTDPSTHIADQPLAPDLRVEGELVTDGRNVTGDLRIVDPNTGEVLERITVETQERDWGDLLAELAGQLAERLRTRRPTTTTTSTTASTGASTSSTSATVPPTTTPTSGPPTTTTVAAGGTCTSVIPASFCECSGGNRTTCTSDAICQLHDEGRCVDHVGHTVVTFRLAGSGGRLGALRIDGGDDGLMGVPGGVGVRTGCGSTGFTERVPAPIPADETSCPTLYHPGATITITARREVPPAPFLGDLYCASRFTGFSGAVGCAGTGDCTKYRCTCSTVTGTEKTEIVATYESDGTGCIPAAAP